MIEGDGARQLYRSNKNGQLEDIRSMYMKTKALRDYALYVVHEILQAIVKLGVKANDLKKKKNLQLYKRFKAPNLGV